MGNKAGAARGLAGWAAGLGYKAAQLPTHDARFLGLRPAAESKGYCDNLRGSLARHGLEVSELSTRLQGQLICAGNPAGRGARV